MNGPQNQLIYQIALTLIPGVGDVTAKNLISYCGSVEGVFKQKKSHLLKIPEVGKVTANAIVNHSVFERAEEEVKFIEQNNIQTFFYLDEEYPTRLKHCIDAPLLLYGHGSLNLNAARTVVIVGTRNATEYGKDITRQFVNDLKQYDVTIISGLAYGIDVCAHKACIEKDIPTIGVLAHGLDDLYPALHRKVADNMKANGGLLTEFITQSKPNRENFPKRNRVVAGMADVVLVVEAGKKGGALITADIADSYNREVFAVPGKIGDTYSEGCNQLIFNNRAHLALNAQKLAEMMFWDVEMEKQNKPKQRELFIELSEEEKTILDILGSKDKLDIDSIRIQSSMPVSAVANTLLNLEFNGLIKSLPGKIYQLKEPIKV
jgi:DNA processing protein